MTAQMNWNMKGHLFHQHQEVNKEMPPWFFENCTREEAESTLTLGKKYGNVLMRESSSSGSYVISYRQEVTGGTQINHYKVTKVMGGFKIDVDNPHDVMASLMDVMDFFATVAGRGTRPMLTNDREALSLPSSTRSRGSVSSEDGRPPLLHDMRGSSYPGQQVPTLVRNPHNPMVSPPPPPPPPAVGVPPPPPAVGVPSPLAHPSMEQSFPPGGMHRNDSFSQSSGSPTSPHGPMSPGAAPNLPPRVRNVPPEYFKDPSLNQPVPSKLTPSDTLLRTNPNRDIEQQMPTIAHSLEDYPGQYPGVQHSRASSIPPMPPPAPPAPGIPAAPMMNHQQMELHNAMNSLQPNAMSLRPTQPTQPRQYIAPKPTFEDELKRRVAVQREDIYATGKMEIRQNWN